MWQVRERKLGLQTRVPLTHNETLGESEAAWESSIPACKVTMTSLSRRHSPRKLWGGELLLALPTPQHPSSAPPSCLHAFAQAVPSVWPLSGTHMPSYWPMPVHPCPVWSNLPVCIFHRTMLFPSQCCYIVNFSNACLICDSPVAWSCNEGQKTSVLALVAGT